MLRKLHFLPLGFGSFIMRPYLSKVIGLFCQYQDSTRLDQEKADQAMELGPAGEGGMETMVHRETRLPEGRLYKQGRLKVKDKVEGGMGMLWRAESHHRVYIKFTSSVSDKWYLASALKS